MFTTARRFIEDAARKLSPAHTLYDIFDARIQEMREYIDTVRWLTLPENPIHLAIFPDNSLAVCDKQFVTATETPIDLLILLNAYAPLLPAAKTLLETLPALPAAGPAQALVQEIAEELASVQRMMNVGKSFAFVTVSSLYERKAFSDILKNGAKPINSILLKPLPSIFVADDGPVPLVLFMTPTVLWYRPITNASWEVTYDMPGNRSAA